MFKGIEKFIKKIVLSFLSNRDSSKSRKSKFIFNSDSRLLAIRLNLVGDALVVSPLLKILKENSGCKIDVLASIRNKPAFEGNPFVDNILIFEKGIKNFFKLLRKINNNNYDFIIDLHDDTSTTVSLIMAYAVCDNKFGLTKDNLKLYTRRVERLNPEKFHVIERNMEISKLFRLQYDLEDTNIVYRIKNESTEFANKFLSDNKISENDFIIGINLFAGSEARFWGENNFKKLIELLLKRNYKIILLSNRNKLEETEKISNSVPCFYGSFDEYAAMISKLSLIFTPDTAAIHLASVFNIPVFGLYVKYNTKNLIWYPYKSKYDCVITNEPTLKNISFNDVKEKLIPFIESIKN